MAGAGFVADVTAHGAGQRPGAARRRVEQNFPGRLGEPDEIAARCAYLLADESGFTSRAELVIDGGSTAETRSAASAASMI